jgi:hypothetical protein
MKIASVVLVLCLCASATGIAEAAGAARTPAKAAGVQLRSAYATARGKLIGSGWRTDAAWGTSGVHAMRAYPKYPEVLCGEGYDAVCTGRFEKDGIAILVSIDPKSSALRVTSVDED